MPSLAARYAAGEHQAVWSELDQGAAIAPGEVEEIMRDTFGRVARNTDLLIARLRDTGYRFECEAGRRSDPVPPRSPGAEDGRTAQVLAEALFDGFPALDATPGPFPPALAWFAELVGNVDLRQRYPYRPPSVAGLDARAGLSEEQSEELDIIAQAMRDAMPKPNPDELFLDRQVAQEDALPHPHADDPVLSRLGDWDPLVVDFGIIAYDLGDEEAEMAPLPGGGVGHWVEFAENYATKADVSGGRNPSFIFPGGRHDPIVHADGIELPFTTWLRHTFARGGFFGVPAVLRPAYGDMALIEVEPGIYLPDHPAFADLAQGLEPF